VPHQLDIKLSHYLNAITPHFLGKSTITRWMEKAKTNYCSVTTVFGFSWLIEGPLSKNQFVNLCEPNVSKLILSLRDKLGFHTFIDVGSNRGWYSLLVSHGSNTRSIAFEPNLQTRELLRKNVEANDLQDKVSVFSFALSDTIGPQNFYQSNFKDNDGMASLSSPLAQSNKSQVDVITLDSFWLEYVKSHFSPESEPIILIKLDIEGGEFRALQGAKRLINEIRPFILCEINSTFLEYASQIDGTTLIKFLVDLDYDVLYISETRGLEFVTSAHDLPHELTFGKEHGGNYLFIPRTSTFDSQFWLRTPLTYFAFKTLVMNRVKNLFDQIFRNRN